MSHEAAHSVPATDGQLCIHPIRSPTARHEAGWKMALLVRAFRGRAESLTYFVLRDLI